MESHQIPQAPRQLQRLSKDPDKLLIVVDPRISETAKIADIHLRIRPGTDALLLKSMIAIILKEGWINKDYMENHTAGFEQVKSCLKILMSAPHSKSANLILIRFIRSPKRTPNANPLCVTISVFSWDVTAA